MTREEPLFTIEIRRPLSDFFVASSPQLRGLHAHGDTMADVLVNASSAARALYDYMHSRVLAGEKPTAQYEEYRKVFGR